MFGLSPLALVLIGWAATAVIGGGGTLWYRDALHSLQARDAKEAALAEQHLNDEKAADAKQTQALATITDQIKQAIQDTRDDAKAAFAKVASNPNCAHTAASDLFDSRLRAAAPKADPRKP